MYLSRLILNLRNRRVQHELAEPYQMHRSIMRSFPDELAAGEERVLWRVDDHPQLGAMLLVQSRDAPDWTWLAEDSARGYLLPINQPNPAIKPFELKLATGQTFKFRLRANPTVKRRFADSNDHKRVGLYEEGEQVQWLQRKASDAGFRILSVNVVREGQSAGRKSQDGQVHRLTLLAVRFDGLLQVIDPDALVEAVRTGIGSAKGLGFGLLSLAPPS
jgi:CRISPR system Cascade subunit CasE